MKTTNGKKLNKLGKVYPESSARQALWGQRRKQGGPGITEGKDPQPKERVLPKGVIIY